MLCDLLAEVVPQGFERLARGQITALANMMEYRRLTAVGGSALDEHQAG